MNKFEEYLSMAKISDFIHRKELEDGGSVGRGAAEAEAGRTAGEPEQRREAERGGQPSGGAGGEQKRGEGRSLQRRLFRHAHRGGAGAGGQDAAGEPGGPGA